MTIQVAQLTFESDIPPAVAQEIAEKMARYARDSSNKMGALSDDAWLARYRDGMQRAYARLDNGYLVSIITGPLTMPHWEPGRYEACVLWSPRNGEEKPLVDTITRGAAPQIDAFLAMLESLPPRLSEEEVINQVELWHDAR
jgi:hypothetical protein